MTDEASTIPDRVANEETLFRAVANDLRFLPVDEQGIRRISSMAFNDVARRPSVDRASLCPGGAIETRDRFRAGSGVLSLIAGEVRELSTTHGSTGRVYGVDVEPVPLTQNSAHAEIYGRPPFDTDKIFDRIKQALSQIATLTLSPAGLDELQ